VYYIYIPILFIGYLGVAKFIISMDFAFSSVVGPVVSLTLFIGAHWFITEFLGID
jgi:hypothetical protein